MISPTFGTRPGANHHMLDFITVGDLLIVAAIVVAGVLIGIWVERRRNDGDGGD